MTTLIEISFRVGGRTFDILRWHKTMSFTRLNVLATYGEAEQPKHGLLCYLHTKGD